MAAPPPPPPPPPPPSPPPPPPPALPKIIKPSPPKTFDSNPSPPESEVEKSPKPDADTVASPSPNSKVSLPPPSGSRPLNPQLDVRAEMEKMKILEKKTLFTHTHHEFCHRDMPQQRTMQVGGKDWYVDKLGLDGKSGVLTKLFADHEAFKAWTLLKYQINRENNVIFRCCEPGRLEDFNRMWNTIIPREANHYYSARRNDFTLQLDVCSDESKALEEMDQYMDLLRISPDDSARAIPRSFDLNIFFNGPIVDYMELRGLTKPLRDAIDRGTVVRIGFRPFAVWDKPDTIYANMDTESVQRCMMDAIIQYGLRGHVLVY